MFTDAHAHLASGPEALKKLLESMRKLNIQRAVVVGGGLVTPKTLAAQLNGESEAGELPTFDHIGMLAQCSLADQKLLPFYFANPFRSVDEYKTIGHAFYGLKFGPLVYPAPLTSPETTRYIEVARKFSHPVYLHCVARDGFRVDDLLELAAMFKDVAIILGHGGIGHLDFSAVDKIAPFKNLYYETSGAFKAVVKHACATLGTDRILFGSEHPLQSAAAELAKIRDLDLTDDQFLAVTKGNIERLLPRRAV